MTVEELLNLLVSCPDDWIVSLNDGQDVEGINRSDIVLTPPDQVEEEEEI